MIDFIARRQNATSWSCAQNACTWGKKDSLLAEATVRFQLVYGVFFAIKVEAGLPISSLRCVYGGLFDASFELLCIAFKVLCLITQKGSEGYEGLV